MMETEVQIHLGFLLNDPERKVLLEVTDKPSGIRMLTLEMDPLELRDLLSGGLPTVPHAKLPAGSALAKLGKQREVVVWTPDDDLQRNLRSYHKETAIEDAEVMARREHPGYEDYKARQHNYGISVVCTRWVDQGERAGEESNLL